MHSGQRTVSLKLQLVVPDAIRFPHYHLQSQPLLFRTMDGLLIEIRRCFCELYACFSLGYYMLASARLFANAIRRSK